MPGLLEMLGFGQGAPRQMTPARDAAAVPAMQGGLLGGIGDAFNRMRTENPEFLDALSVGLMKGDVAGALEKGNEARAQRQYREQQMALQREGWDRDDARSERSFGLQEKRFAIADRRQAAEDRKTQAYASGTAKWLRSSGGNADEIALAEAGDGATAFRMFTARTKQGRDLETIYDDQGREQKGYFNSNGDFVRVGGSKAAAGGAEAGAYGKPPSGFMYDPRDPSRLAPIPGGPGEQISPELAARLGLANHFLDEDAPGLREDLQAGNATGPIDRLASNFSGTDQAGTYQKLQSGTDALMRMLTGAGMNESEARSYAGRYLPGDFDTADSAVRKLDQLTSELARVRDEAMRGRGGAASAPAAEPNSGRVPGAQAQTGTVPSSLKSRYGLR